MYRLNGGTWQTSQFFRDLAAGDYTVQARDARGCLSAIYDITV